MCGSNQQIECVELLHDRRMKFQIGGECLWGACRAMHLRQENPKPKRQRRVTMQQHLLFEPKILSNAKKACNIRAAGSGLAFLSYNIRLWGFPLWAATSKKPKSTNFRRIWPKAYQ